MMFGIVQIMDKWWESGGKRLANWCLFLMKGDAPWHVSLSSCYVEGLQDKLLALLEAEYFAGFVAVGDFAAQQFGHADYFVHKLAVALGQHAALQI